MFGKLFQMDGTRNLAVDPDSIRHAAAISQARGGLASGARHHGTGSPHLSSEVGRRCAQFDAVWSLGHGECLADRGIKTGEHILREDTPAELPISVILSSMFIRLL